MKQAKTLTAAELRRVTDSIATRAHPVRNRVMLMMTHLKNYFTISHMVCGVFCGGDV